MKAVIVHQDDLNDAKVREHDNIDQDDLAAAMDGEAVILRLDSGDKRFYRAEIGREEDEEDEGYYISSWKPVE